jgi:trimeric autotransporter adhesin
MKLSLPFPLAPSEQSILNRKSKTMKTSNLRNPIDRSPLRSGLLFIALALGCFALSATPKAFGVVPAPDGGYPGFHTAEGQNALKNLSTGQGNTALGWFSLFSDTTGSFNTGVGAGTLALNTGDNNTATGAVALFLNTTGFQNTAVGAAALLNNTEGDQNTATGFEALFSNTTGVENSAFGAGALSSNGTGSSNTAIGEAALNHNTGGFGNTASGDSALLSNSIGSDNTATGYSALTNNTEGTFNTANGSRALFDNTTGAGNTATGDSALDSNTEGNGNTAIGLTALNNNTSGNNNTALGQGAGFNITTASNVIAIGHPGANVDNSCYIGNIYQATIDPSGLLVGVDSTGKLGTAASSRRFKEDIKPMDKASEALLSLKPVTFRYKNYKNSPLRFGLIAEEVAEVNPDLVARDKNGEIYTVRYDQINAMLLNEFLKEHRKVEQQQATITELKSTVARQQSGMEVLTAQLKEQAEQIQKVTAQIETNKFARRTAGRIRRGGLAPQMVINP